MITPNQVKILDGLLRLKCLEKWGPFSMGYDCAIAVDIAHIVPKQRSHKVRWEIDNVIPLSRAAHWEFDNDKAFHLKVVNDTIGIERYHELKLQSNQPGKFLLSFEEVKESLK